MLEIFKPIIDLLESNDLHQSAQCLRDELGQKQEIKESQRANKLMSLVYNVVNEANKKSKVPVQANPQVSLKKTKYLTQQETEDILENYMGKIVTKPDLLADEGLNAQIEKFFDNPTFQRIVEQTDVFQDISNMSLNQSMIPKYLKNQIKNTEQSSIDFDGAPKFGNNMFIQEAFNTLESDQQEYQQKKQNEIILEKFHDDDELFSSQQIQIIDNNEINPHSHISLKNNLNTENDQLFQNILADTIEDRFSHIIDEYENDEDPGFDLYEVGIKDFASVAHQIAQKYGFPDKAVEVKNTLKKQKSSKKMMNANDLSFNNDESEPLDDQSIVIPRKKNQKRNLAAHLRHPDSKDSFYPVEFENTIYDCFNLKVIFDREKTGFEESKDFPIVINSIIAGRYQIVEYLGSAAFSKAIQCRDLTTGHNVCMKIIENNKDYFDQSIDEIKLLSYINQNANVDDKNVLKIYDYFYHKEHLFIITELLKENLYEYQKLNKESGEPQYFNIPRLQKITKQILVALDYIHSIQLIHCDLKPENILMKSYSKAEIKVIDFGSSCFVHDHLSSYIQSRSYRAPEVILGCEYDYKIDMWSLGCILAEMWTGDVLFQNDTIQMLLARVVGIVGPFPDYVMKTARLADNFFTPDKLIYQEVFEDENGEQIMMQQGPERRGIKTGKIQILVPKITSLKNRLKCNDIYFVDFVRCLLELDPNKRPSAKEAMNHPFLQEGRYSNQL